MIQLKNNLTPEEGFENKGLSYYKPKGSLRKSAFSKGDLFTFKKLSDEIGYLEVKSDTTKEHILVPRSMVKYIK